MQNSFYVRLITVLIYQKRPNLWVNKYLAAGGRMALTNYLMQSFTAACIVYPFGLGFYQNIGPAACRAIVLGVYLFQLMFSKWYLERYGIGPIVFLLRRMTYHHRKVSDVKDLVA